MQPVYMWTYLTKIQTVLRIRKKNWKLSPFPWKKILKVSYTNLCTHTFLHTCGHIIDIVFSCTFFTYDVFWWSFCVCAFRVSLFLWLHSDDDLFNRFSSWSTSFYFKLFVIMECWNQCSCIHVFVYVGEYFFRINLQTWSCSNTT